MNSIHVNFSDSRAQFEVKQGEHNINTLVFDLPTDFSEADFVNAEFKKSDETTEVVEQLTPTNGTVTVPLTQNLIDTRGTLKVQLVAYRIDGSEIVEIAKSPIVTGVVQVSLNALYNTAAGGFIERLLAFISDASEKIAELMSVKHTHNNKATLDEFYCSDIENPPTNPPIGYEGSGRRVLSFDGSALRFTSEGGVVRNVETLTANGQTFLRLWFDYGNNSDFEIVPGGYYRPAFIDIPVSSAVESTAPGTGGLIVNGTEIDFGISELETDRHTHNNMTQLNQLTSTKMSNINDAVSKKHSHTNSSVLGSLSYLRQKDSYLLTYGGECVCNFPVVRIGVDSDGIPEDETNKYANIKYIIGDESHPVSRFFVGVLNKSVSEAMVNWNGEEFFFEFYTGETAPTVTLPFYLEFPTELTVEPNKHYQISIVDKVALWCASDYTAPAGEVTA